MVPVLFTFYTQDVLKLKTNSGAKRLITVNLWKSSYIYTRITNILWICCYQYEIYEHFTKLATAIWSQACLPLLIHNERMQNTFLHMQRQEFNVTNTEAFLTFTRPCLCYSKYSGALLNYYTNHCTYIKFIKLTHYNIKNAPTCFGPKTFIRELHIPC